LAGWLLASGLAAGQTYSVTQITANGSANAINNYGQVVGSSGSSAFLWTPLVANSTAGSLIDLGGLPANAPSGAAAWINDRGQVVGTTDFTAFRTSEAFLWTPDTPNGTTGSMVAFAGSAEDYTTFTAQAINSFGQIIGQYAGYSYIWTPSAANGTTGTLDADVHLDRLAAINDLGQGVISGGQQMILFTPASPNSTQGTFTTLGTDTGVAINRNGTVLGSSSLWTPNILNGTVGSTTALPPLAGVTWYALALNNSGQVAGYQRRANGTFTPVLYSGGAVTDLSAVSALLSGGSAVAINDAGEIVVNANNAVYLVSWAMPSQPAPGEVAVTIASQPAGQAFTVTGTGCHPGGYTAPQMLGWIPGSACTVAFLSPQSNSIGTRYLFNGWQDGLPNNANPRPIVAAAQQATFTANFSTQYFVTTAEDLPESGTISGGGWYFAGVTATLTATPAGGYRLVSLTEAPLGTTPNGNTLTATVNAPFAVTANFTPMVPSAPGQYVQTLIADNASAFSGNAVNNYGQAVGHHPILGSGTAEAFLWTPVSANGINGSLIDLAAGAAKALNNRGQVIGLPATGDLEFLWSPAMANGTTGSIVSMPEGVFFQAMNDYGQAISSGVLWTPTTPNGTTGTLDMDSHLSDAVGINDFGQVVTITNTLFTPSTPNSTTGTYTQISGVGTPMAINRYGAVLGDMAESNGGVVNMYHGYVWTPSSPNGTVGTAVEIPRPNGFISLQPFYINGNGDVAGILVRADAQYTPFLYTGGAVYDLGGQIQIAGEPAGINDRGQILYQGWSSLYLYTPVTLVPPAPVGVSPASGGGLSQTMTFTFTDPLGWQDMAVADILINNALDGRNACYLGYSIPANVLVLVNDAGASGGPWAGSLTPGSAGTIQNSQCEVGLISAVGTDNTLTLTLSITLSAAFGGNKVVYLAARSARLYNPGWVPLGVWQVPATAEAGTIGVIRMEPASGTGLGPTGYTLTVSDTKGYQDLGVENVLINSMLDGRHACYLAYARQVNTLYLVNDNGDALLPGQSVSTSGSISNSQCTVSWGNNAAIANGNTLTLALNIGFASGFGPNLVFYLAARDVNEANNTGWQPSATWVAR